MIRQESRQVIGYLTQRRYLQLLRLAVVHGAYAHAWLAALECPAC